MQVSAFYCDCCETNIDESKDTAPIIAQITLGLTPLAQARHPEGFDFTKVAMPEKVRKLLQKPLPRADLCLDCFPDVAKALADGQRADAEGTRRALPSRKSKAVEKFLADDLTSLRPEHPNRVIREQHLKAERERLAQQGSQAVESPEERTIRLRKELADAEAAVEAKKKASTKRTQRAAKKKATA